MMQESRLGLGSQIMILRGILYLLFLVYPVIFLQGRFFDAILNPFLDAGNFFLAVALFLALLATLTLNYALGYVTFLAVMIADFAFGTPLIIFTSHLAIALSFAEGTSSLSMYQSVARQIREGAHESASFNLQECLHRFRKVSFLVCTTLFTLSIAYAFLPEIVPTPASLSALAVYATISLIAIALTVLYLGSRE